MRKALIALAAGLMTISSTSVMAAAPQERRYQDDRRDDRHDDRRGHHDRGDDRYGRWESNWGARPPAPPRHWARQNDWYRHVRACQARYRSYNPRTDQYVVRRGVMRRCML